MSGNTLYRININGTATSIGTIPGAARVSMAHNQITDGNEVMIATGQDGYVYNTVTGVLAKVTDEGFPGLKVADFVDGYIGGIEPGGRFWLHSNLAAATDYSTIDRYEGETSPDKMVGFAVSHREVVVLSERTLDVFGNTGATTGTFERIDGKSQEVGCASTHSVAVMDSAVWWLGDDGSVYRMFGGAPERISTQPMEQAIAELNWEQAFATVWEDRGHKVYYLTFPDGMTWGFDVASGEWHRRQSFALNRWRLSTLTYWNGDWYGGDYSNGKVYRLDWDVMSEDDAPMVSERITSTMHGDGNRMPVAGLRLDFAVGRAPVTETDHAVDMRYSDDGGHNWSNFKARSLGAAGEFRQRVTYTRLGSTRARI
ncbi:MAG: hypothetical protein H0V66_00265, partial [Bdellovibrionales bacterium]|nr:hypothetical protein [Bdellovibrionales bacterium]